MATSLIESLPHTPSWISDGEKYALVGMDVNIKGVVTAGQLGKNLWLIDQPSFLIPDHWREWLGSIRMSELKNYNIFLLSKALSSPAHILNTQNNHLLEAARHFYVGLMLASRFAPAYQPVLLTGASHQGEIHILEQQDLRSPVPCLFRAYPPVTADDFCRAAQLGEAITDFPSAKIVGGHWRLFHSLQIYVEARSTSDLLERVHQYCRVIEGLIVPRAGDTKKQFKSRTELFIGPRHHDLIGNLYDFRSDVEHLHAEHWLDPFDREKRLKIVKFEAVAEYIARSALVRIFGNPTLWPHFANATSLKEFWALPESERRRLWGANVDPSSALADFDPEFIDDGRLGLI